jgi:2-haloacid dehalogenase
LPADIPAPALPGIRACVFDAYGTLFDVNSAAARMRDALGDKADALSAIWRTKQLEYTWLRSLMGRHADFWQVTGEALDFAMADIGVHDAGLREDLMAHYLALDAYPDAAPVLAQLRGAGLATAILSNGAPAMLQAGADSARLTERLDAILSVEEAGIFKPHPATYRLAVDRLGVLPEAVCFVSSNGWDVAGAAAFGFRVAWLNRMGRTPERLPAGPDVEIRGLDALPGLIGL